MCIKTCTKMVKRDYAGLDRVPLDSLKMHDIILLKYSDMRAIPTLQISFGFNKLPYFATFLTVELQTTLPLLLA